MHSTRVLLLRDANPVTMNSHMRAMGTTPQACFISSRCSARMRSCTMRPLGCRMVHILLASLLNVLDDAQGLRPTRLRLATLKTWWLPQHYVTS